MPWSGSSSGAKASRCSIRRPTSRRLPGRAERGARWPNSVGQQRDGEVDQDEAAEPEHRAGEEHQADHQRIDVRVVGDPGADAEDLAVVAVEVEAGRRAAGRATVERVHARIPTTEWTSCACTARLLTISRPLMNTAPTTASA